MEENHVQILIYPTYIHAPHYTDPEYLHGKDVYKQLYICNCAYVSPLTGAPEMTVPIGQHSRGAGIGMELFAQKNEEQLLLNAAYGYTEKFDHRTAPKAAPELHRGEEKLSDILADYEFLREEKHHGIKEPEETVAEFTEPPETEAALEEQELQPEKKPHWPIYALLLTGVAVLMGVRLYRGKKNHTA